MHAANVRGAKFRARHIRMRFDQVVRAKHYDEGKQARKNTVSAPSNGL